MWRTFNFLPRHFVNVEINILNVNKYYKIYFELLLIVKIHEYIYIYISKIPCRDGNFFITSTYYNVYYAFITLNNIIVN